MYFVTWGRIVPVMNDNKAITAIYTLFLGLILALFVGLGVNTFYEAPKMPEFPQIDYSFNEEGPSEEQQKAQENFDKEFKQFDSDNKTYNRNVSIITLAASVVMLVISFALERKNAVISGGVLLSGVFLLAYSIIRGLMADDSKYTFATVAAGALIALYLGYRHFNNGQKKPSKKSHKKK